MFADSLSGLRECHPNVMVGFDPVLRSAALTSRLVPEVIVRVGDPPASKVLAQWAVRTGADIVQVRDHELVVDPDHAVSLSVSGPSTGSVGCSRARWCPRGGLARGMDGG